jgi:hypothetical protein
VKLDRAARDGKDFPETVPRDAILVFKPTAFVNATGAWVDHTLTKIDVSSRRLMGGTKGSHFLTFHPQLREALNNGGVYAEAADGRPVFLLPMGDATLVVTTNLPFEDRPERAVASDVELQYLLAVVHRCFHRSDSRAMTYIFTTAAYDRSPLPINAPSPRFRAGSGWKNMPGMSRRCIRSSAET